MNRKIYKKEMFGNLQSLDCIINYMNSNERYKPIRRLLVFINDISKTLLNVKDSPNYKDILSYINDGFISRIDEICDKCDYPLDIRTHLKNFATTKIRILRKNEN